MRGRQTKLYDRTEIEVTLPTKVVGAVHAELFDPSRGCVPRGSVAALVEQLFLQWLSERGVRL